VGEETPFEQMPPPVFMHVRVFMVLGCICLLHTSISFHGLANEENQATMTSSIEVDIACLVDENESCSSDSKNHMIEYFSADWCIPCTDVDAVLSTLMENDTNIVLHQSSNFDENYTSASFAHFEGEYRLLYFPSVVYNGEFLFTGNRQVLDLEALTNTTSLQSIDTDDVLVNTTLFFTGSSLEYWEIWYTIPVVKERSGVTFDLVQSVAYISSDTPQLDVNETFDIQQGGKLFINSWTYGERGQFIQGSNASASGFDFLRTPEDQQQKDSTSTQTNLPYIVGGVLFLLLYPALVSHYNLMRKQSMRGNEHSEE
jgi:hypothetical protein